MNIEQQANFLKLIDSDFKGMHNMLTMIQEKITEYPVYTQIEFYKPILHMIVEAFQDATNPKDDFLNSYDEGDKIEI